MILRLTFFVLFQLSSLVLLAESSKVRLYYLDNKKDKYTLKEVDSLYHQKQLTGEDNSLNLGFNVSNVWVRINTVASNDLILTIKNAHLDHIYLYVFSGETLIDTIHSGDAVAFDKRYISSNFFNFLIPENATHVYMKIQTQGPMLVPVHLLYHTDFFIFLQKNGIFHWIYLGCILLIFITNLLLFIWLRESVSIYYSLYLLSVGLITAVDFGYSFQYLWPYFPSVNQYNAYFYFLSFFTILFTEKLLNLKENSRPLYSFFHVVYVCFFITVLVSFFLSYNATIQLIFYLVLFISLLSLASGVFLFVKYKSEYSAFFMTGWAIFMLCVFVYTLAVSGLLEFNSVTGNILQIGSLIEITFFNLAILSRINLLKKEKEKLLLEKNKELTEMNEKLMQKNNLLRQYTQVTNHNLRGPVATLMGLHSIYNMHSENDPMNSIILTKAKDTVYKIDSIIKDLNNLLNLENEPKLSIQPVDINLILEEVKNDLSSELEKSQAIIRSDFSEIYILNSYREYIKNVFYQLIGNSIKFKKPDSVPDILITSGQDEQRIYLTFRDKGIGIDLAQHMKDLFNPYKKFHANTKGKGLGLSILKKQVDLMGGEIQVESQPQEGCKFTVVLKKQEI